jgi:hypothetical protein
MWKEIAEGVFAAFVGFGAFFILACAWVFVYAIVSWTRRGD